MFSFISYLFCIFLQASYVLPSSRQFYDLKISNRCLPLSAEFRGSHLGVSPLRCKATVVLPTTVPNSLTHKNGTAVTCTGTQRRCTQLEGQRPEVIISPCWRWPGSRPVPSLGSSGQRCIHLSHILAFYGYLVEFVLFPAPRRFCFPGECFTQDSLSKILYLILWSLFLVLYIPFCHKKFGFLDEITVGP